jgi:hypothetical protein
MKGMCIIPSLNGSLCWFDVDDKMIVIAIGILSVAFGLVIIVAVIGALLRTGLYKR